MFGFVKKYINLKVIFGAIFFALCIFVFLLGILWSVKADTVPQAPATALLNVIDAPTATPPATVITPTPAQENLSTQAVPLPASEINIGNFGQGGGTGG